MQIKDADASSVGKGALMKTLTFSAIVLSVSVLGFASGAQAQVGKLSFEGDMVRGAQAGAPGPFCVLTSRRRADIGEPFVVGTVVTDRPPHRTARAEFPHAAPTSGG